MKDDGTEIRDVLEAALRERKAWDEAPALLFPWRDGGLRLSAKSLIGEGDWDHIPTHTLAAAAERAAAAGHHGRPDRRGGPG